MNAAIVLPLLLYFLPMLIILAALRIEHRRVGTKKGEAEALVLLALVPAINLLYALLAVLLCASVFITRILIGDKEP